jgi:hypothetical protein
MPGVSGYGPDGQWQGERGWQQHGGSGGGLSGLGGKLSGLPRPRGPVVPAIGVAAVIIVIAAGIVFIRGNSGSSQNTAGSGAGVPAASASASASAQPQTNPQEKQAATAMAGLLSQSGGDRGGVNHAYFAVQACKTLPADQKEFVKAAANRAILVNKLKSLPDASALNPAMVQALTGAWQASAAADTDYAKWAGSLEHGCKPGKTGNNPNLKASNGPDGQATADKQQFTGLWNPVAQKYGLATYQPGQL